MRFNIKHHIKDIIYGANDGIITTFAVVAGVAGADLSATTTLIIGMSNLFADGFSMAVSDYLGTKSEHEAMNSGGEKEGKESHHPKLSAVITLIAFVVAGSIPLWSYIVGSGSLSIASWSSAGALFLVGSTRSIVTGKHFLRSGFEMLILGGLAAIIAYAVGAFVKSIVG